MTKETIDLVMSYRFLLTNKCRDADDIDDIMQDAMLKLLQSDKVESLENIEKRKYINRCIMNSYVDFIRKKKSQKRDGITIEMSDYSYLEEFSNTHTAPDVHAKIELKEVMKRGKQHQFFPILIAFAEGYTNKEIAEMTGSNLNTTLGRCRYTRIFLKK